MRESTRIAMDPIIGMASDSFSSEFGSSFNSMLSESDHAWCYAQHVVNAPQPIKNLMGDDDSQCTNSENSDDDIDTQAVNDETDHSRNGSRQKQKYRPRFTRQSSNASMSSTNEKKNERSMKRTSKSPAKSRNHTEILQCDNKQSRADKPKIEKNGATGVSSLVARNEPDMDERRKIRRLVMLRKKSEEMWGSPLESSDSDESSSHQKNKTTMSKTTPPIKLKKFKKKTYEYDCAISPIRVMKRVNRTNRVSKSDEDENQCAFLESESERSNSPHKSNDSPLGDKNNSQKIATKTSPKKNRSSSNQREAVESEIERSSPFTPKTRTYHAKTRAQHQREVLESESERSLSPAKVKKISATRALKNKAKTPESERERSLSPSKRKKQLNTLSVVRKNAKKESSLNDACKSEKARSCSPFCKLLELSMGSDRSDSSQRPLKINSSEKKSNNYEMIPKGSLRQSRSAGRTSSNDEMIPTGSLRGNTSLRRAASSDGSLRQSRCGGSASSSDEMIPTGSLRENRSSRKAGSSDDLIPTGSLRQNRYTGRSLSNDKGKIDVPMQRNHISFDKSKSPTETHVDDLLPSAKQLNVRSEKTTVPVKRQLSLDRPKHDCEKALGNKVNEKQTKVLNGRSEKPIGPVKRQQSLDRSKHDDEERKVPALSNKLGSVHHQSSFTEKKRIAKKLDESLLNLPSNEFGRTEGETGSTTKHMEKSRYAVTPPPPRREYSSNSLSTSTTVSTTLSPLRAGVSPIKGTYKNSVDVKKIHGHHKKHLISKTKDFNNEGGGTKTTSNDNNSTALDDIMKSRRFRNIDLQKKTNQYLAATTTTTSNNKTTKTWW